MILNLIKLADSLDNIGNESAADGIDSIIEKLAGIGGDGMIEELVQELVSDVYRRKGSLFDMKDSLTSILSRHTDPRKLLPKDHEGLGDSPAEEVANYFTDLVTDLWKQTGGEESPTQMYDIEHMRELTPDEKALSEPTEMDVKSPLNELTMHEGDMRGEWSDTPEEFMADNEPTEIGGPPIAAPMMWKDRPR